MLRKVELFTECKIEVFPWGKTVEGYCPSCKEWFIITDNNSGWFDISCPCCETELLFVEKKPIKTKKDEEDEPMNNTTETKLDSPIHSGRYPWGKETNKGYVFISGPMAGYPNDNREAFMKAEEWLEGHGYDVFNPARMPAGLSREMYLAMDLAALEKCKYVVLLDGWEKAERCRLELRKAMDLHMPVATLDERYKHEYAFWHDPEDELPPEGKKVAIYRKGTEMCATGGYFDHHRNFTTEWAMWRPEDREWKGPGFYIYDCDEDGDYYFYKCHKDERRWYWAYLPKEDA